VAFVLASALLPSAVAPASVYTDVLHVYQLNGSIPPCRFSSAQLSTALKGIDTYGQQYFADFTNAVQSALAARASGVCTPGVSRAAPSARAQPSFARPALPPSVTAPTSAGVPAPIVLMAALALVVAAVLAVRALALAGGWEPEWAVRWRHAWGEASYRAGGSWADFVDWLRARR
jgi:hypothetical protein